MPDTEKLRPRTAAGKAVTNIRLKTNWSDWSEETSAASSPLDTANPVSYNTTDLSSVSSLSSVEEEERNNNIIPFPELEVPELDLELPWLENKPRLCRSKLEPLSSISVTPNYDLDKFFALATITHPRANMTTETPQIFHGDGRASENPADFLKSFNRAMRQQSITTTADKLEVFGDYLGTSSQVEVWFLALPTISRTTWAIFVTEFEARWPPLKIAEKTKAEYEKELLEHTLQHTEVGKKTKLYDRECWTHVAWAAKTLQLATSAGIAQGTSMIWQVRSMLPDIVKDLLKDEEYANWAEFVKAVTELKGSRLVEKQEQYNRQAQELNTLKTDLARIRQQTPVPNPADALQSQFSRMSVNTTSASANVQNNSGYTRTPANQNRQSTQPTYSRQPSNTAVMQQPVVVMEELKANVRRLIAAFPHHPDTPAGNMAHAAQITQWNGKWGDNTRVTHETGYPLKPGTATI